VTSIGFGVADPSSGFRQLFDRSSPVLRKAFLPLGGSSWKVSKVAPLARESPSRDRLRRARWRGTGAKAMWLAGSEASASKSAQEKGVVVTSTCSGRASTRVNHEKLL
jgi:hypothetical protein